MARKKNDKQNMQRKGIIAAAAVICSMGVLLVGAKVLDRQMNQTAIKQDTYNSEGRHTSYAKGVLKLAGGRYEYYHNFENILFIGTDHSGNEFAEGDDFQNGMGDFLMLMSIDKTDDTYTMIELNRDTMTEVNAISKDGKTEIGLELQLCTAHWYGSSRAQGCDNQVKAVSNLLGDLPIHGYYSIAMDEIQKINHAIGGVTVTLNEDFTNEDPAMKKGATLHLTDQQAFYYLQNRMNVGGGTNEERMARQHSYIQGFLEQGAAKLSESPKYFYDTFDQMNEFAETNLTGKQLSRIAKALTRNESKGQVTFAGKSILGESLDDGLEHAEFYMDPNSLVDVMTSVFGLVKDENYVEEETETESEFYGDEDESEDIGEAVGEPETIS